MNTIERAPMTADQFRAQNRILSNNKKLLFMDIATCPVCNFLTSLPEGIPLSKRELDHIKHHVARPLVEFRKP